MDEPESLGAIGVAAREELDNLTFVVNCNLQRLDGPVRGNGKIIQELESSFRGAGWNVIKVVWGRDWDELLARDVDGVLVNADEHHARTASSRPTRSRPAPTSASTSSAPTRGCARWSSTCPTTRSASLPRGGHDYRKVYAAFKAATEHKRPADGDPRPDDQGLDARQGLRGPQRHPPDEEADQAHELKEFRDRLYLPIPDKRPRGRPAAVLPPGRGLRRDPVHAGAPRGARRLRARRRGRAREAAAAAAGEGRTTSCKQGSGKQAVATTMAFVRLLKDLMQDKEIGKRFVPIIPDEARTFGMDAMFPTAKIYSPLGPDVRGRRPRAAAVLQGGRGRARSCTRASPRPARWRR